MKTIENLKADIKALAGQVAMVESVRTMHPGAARTRRLATGNLAGSGSTRRPQK